jgi:hypothetical protein
MVNPWTGLCVDGSAELLLHVVGSARAIILAYQSGNPLESLGFRAHLPPTQTSLQRAAKGLLAQ